MCLNLTHNCTSTAQGTPNITSPPPLLTKTNHIPISRICPPPKQERYQAAATRFMLLRQATTKLQITHSIKMGRTLLINSPWRPKMKPRMRVNSNRSNRYKMNCHPSTKPKSTKRLITATPMNSLHSKM